MKLSEIKRVYFIGIGGIGMSAIARWFHQKGVTVAGYDRAPSELTHTMENEGISIHYEDNVVEIPNEFQTKNGTLIVYTPAIQLPHSELAHFSEEGYTIHKRSEVLGMITQNHYTIAVSGTHGKTTVASLIAYLLSDSPVGCSAFVGGVMSNSSSNLIVGGDESPMVVEADEYDRSFMRLNPDYLIITSVDPDHLDVYGSEEAMRSAYSSFIQKLSRDGKLLVQSEVKSRINTKDKNTSSYQIGEGGEITATNMRIENDTLVFTYQNEQETIQDISLAIHGNHNVLNALAAITVALDRGMEAKRIKERIKTYKGVKRRFEYVVKTDQVVYIDDYAHHPKEVEAFLSAVRSLSNQRKVTVIFQPHLFSRTRDFMEEFAQVLDHADEVILLDVYPAREAPIRDISSKRILDLMKNEKKALVSKEHLLDELRNRHLEVICTLGAGDIDREVAKISNFLKEEYSQNKNSLIKNKKYV